MLGRAVAVLLVLAPAPAAAAVRWDPVRNLGESAASVRAGASTGGVAAVAWQSPAGVRMRRHVAGVWQPAGTAAGTVLTDLTVTPRGRPVVLVRGPAGLAIAGAGALSTVPGSADARAARVAADDAGHVVVVWYRPANGTTVSIRSATRTGLTWSAPVFVDVGSGQTALHDLVIARGEAHLLYGVSSDSAAEYLGSQPLAGGAWTSVTLAETGPGIGADGDLAALRDGRLAALYRLGGRLRVAVGRGAVYAAGTLDVFAGSAIGRSALAEDARGDLVAVWSRTGQVRSSRRRVTARAWHALPAIRVVAAGVPGVGRLAGGEVVLAVRARGRVLAFSRRSGAGAWTGKRVLAARGATGQVVLAGEGRLVAAWPAVGGVRARLASRRP